MPTKELYLIWITKLSELRPGERATLLAHFHSALTGAQCLTLLTLIRLFPHLPSILSAAMYLAHISFFFEVYCDRKNAFFQHCGRFPLNTWDQVNCCTDLQGSNHPSIDKLNDGCQDVYDSENRDNGPARFGKSTHYAV